MPALRRLAHVLAIACSIAAALAAPAHAAIPADARVRVAGAVDAVAFARIVATRYNVVFSKVVVADFDRDGDADVIATGGPELAVWVNDGAGHLVWQAPARSTGINAGLPDPEWHDSAARTPDTDQNDGAAAAVACDGGTRVRLAASRRTPTADSDRRGSAACVSHTTRAPPSNAD